MNGKDYIKAALFIIAAALFDFFGLDALTVLLLTSVLAFCFAAFGAKAYGFYCVLTVASVFCASEFIVVHTTVLSAFVILVSLCLGFGFYKHKTLSAVMTSSCTAAVFVAAFYVVYIMKTNNISAFHVLTGAEIYAVKTALMQAGSSRLAAQDIDTALHLIDLLLPSMVIITVCLSVYASFGLARYMLEKKGFLYPELRHFSELRLNRGFTALFLIILISTAFFDINGVLINTLSVVMTLIAFCGLSFVDFLLAGKNIKRPVRFIIYALLYVVSALTGIGVLVLMTTLFIIGITDSVKDLRNKNV